MDTHADATRDIEEMAGTIATVSYTVNEKKTVGRPNFDLVFYNLARQNSQKEPRCLLCFQVTVLLIAFTKLL